MNFGLSHLLRSIPCLDRLRSGLAGIVLLFGILFPLSVNADPYDLNVTQWQIDVREQNAGLFYDNLALSYYLDNVPGTFIYGWQGTFLHPVDPNGQAGNGEFTQIGVMSSTSGFDWVFESERPILQCMRGSIPFTTNGPLTGCAGLSGDLVNIGEANPVALYHDVPNNRWVAYVYDNHGNSGPVASISDTGYSGQTDNQIYSSMQVAAERYDGTGANQYLAMSFYFAAPEYGSVGFWPSYNQAAYDYFQIVPPPNPSCIYGGIFDLNGDGHGFYLGSGGNTCSHVFFY